MVSLLLYLVGGIALLILIAQIAFTVSARKRIGREVGNIGGILVTSRVSTSSGLKSTAFAFDRWMIM